jgi:hypothetical protein
LRHRCLALDEAGDLEQVEDELALPVIGQRDRIQVGGKGLLLRPVQDAQGEASELIAVGRESDAAL